MNSGGWCPFQLTWSALQKEKDRGSKLLGAKEEEMTKRAFVLITTAQSKAGEVMNSIKQMTGVVSVHAVTGPYDVIVVLEAEDFTDMGSIVTAQIAHITGVNRWTVCAEHH